MTKKQARSHSADRPRRWLQVRRPSHPVGRGNGRLLCGASLAAMALIGLPSIAHAQQDRYWDPNGTATGSGGTGTWNTSSSTWSPNNDGVSGPYTSWNNASIDNAVFGGANGTVATVTLGTPITVHNVTFNASTTYTLTGSALTLAGTTPTITTNGNATVNSILAGNAGLTKAGAGALTLTGANTFSGGVNVSAGTLSVNGDAALGAASNGIALSAGATLVSTSALAAGRVVTLLSGSSGIGGGVGSAHITGAGGFSLVTHTTLSDDTNDFTGGVATNGFNLIFTSIGNLGEASALGAATTAANGAIYVRNASAVYVGSGNTSNRDWNMAPFTGSSALRNQGTGTLTVTGDIIAGGGYTASVILDAQTADLALLGVISSNLAARPFIFMGGGTNRSITLGNVNTFGGPATIQTVTAKVGSLTNQGVASSLGTGGSISLNTGVLSYTGSGGGTNRALYINGSSSVLNDGTGALALSGAVAFNAGAPADTLTLGGSFVGANTVSGVISGNGSLVMNGIAGSAWQLSGANTYVGATTVTSGTLRAGSSQAFGALNAVSVNGGTLDLNGNDITIASLAGTGGSVALNGGADLTVNGAATTSYGGSITGDGGLVKRGTGTQTLSGASTYSGATAIQGGVLALNFSSAGGPTSNIVSASSALNLSGGTLDAIGAAGEANSQAFNGTNITAGNNTIRAQSGAGGSFTLNLGAINRTGGLVNFVLPTSGNITTISPDGALGGWATINGSDYAKVLAGGIVAFDASDYTDQDNAGLWAAGQIISDAGGAANSGYFGTVGSSVQIGGLRYAAAANSTVTIGAGQALGIDGTIIVAPSVGTFNDTITGGSITGAAGGGTLGVQQNGGGTFTIASTIVDNGGTISFAKAGTGLVSLTGSNTYTGATTVSGGTLAVNTIANGNAVSAMGASGNASSNLVIEGATLQYTGATTISDRGFTLLTSGVVTGGTINVSQSIANLTFTGLVTSPDGAGLTMVGPGTLTLSNAGNDYTGVTTVNGGTLSVGTLANGGSVSGIGAASSASANVVLQSGGELEYSGGTVGTDRGFTLGTGGGAIDVFQGATTLTVSGTALGTGALTKNGAGTLVLSGTNTYSGGTTINAGTLRAGAASAFGAGPMTVNAGGTLDVNNQNLSIGALSGNGTVTNLGTSALTLSGGTGAFNGGIGGSGALTRTGGGIQTFSGCNNTYTGVTSINGSTIAADCLANGGLASGIGASTSTSSNLVFNSGYLIYTGGSVNIDRGFTLANGFGVLTVSNAATILGISGPIVGGAILYKRGPGTLVLSGNNLYPSTVIDEAGILRAGSTTAFGTSGISMGNIAGAILDLNGFNNTVSALNGGGAAGGDITLGGATLTIGNGGFNYAGSISGTGNLVKNGGVGIVQGLLGCRSTYTGTTTINGGTLSVDCLVNGGVNSGIGTSSSAAGNLTLNGGTLFYGGAATSSDRLFTLGTGGGAISSSGTGALNLTNTGAIALSGTNTARTLTLAGTNTGDNVLSAQLDNNGTGATSLTKIGTGTWRLANANSTYTGITTISGGVLSVDKLGNGGIASSIGASAAAAANLVIGNGSTLRYTGAGDTTNRLFTLSPGVTFIESSGTGAIVFTDTGPVTLQTTNQARTIALGGTNTGNNTLAGSIGNAGTGVTTLAKNDSGTWVLTGTNTYTGLTNINAGTLILGNGGTTGAIASATINNLGVLGFNRSDTLIYGGVITQTGAVQQLGAGTTTLTGTNSYTGGTTISAGTLQLGNGGTTGSILGNVLDNGVLAFNRSDIVTFNGVISGSGSVSQSGAGTTILAGINSYAGGTAIDAGTLQVSSDANLGAAAGALSFNNGILRTTADITSARNATLAGAGTVLTDGGTSFTLGGLVSGAGGLTKSGMGALILTGANNYAGGTTIAGGTLSLGNGGTTGSILGDVTNNGSLVFDRSDNIGFGGLVSGSGSVTQRGAGTVTLTANNNYTGVTDVNAGKLLINGNQSAATGLTSVASGAALGGSGIIGGNVNVANGGVLAPGNSPGTMTINGDLSLASGSILDFEFGQADMVGGPLNDLVNVGGNLVLDGTLNVSVSAGGAFGGGIYRVFNYGGTLTDNGLTLGLLPVGSSVTVQTSVAGQVNLINSVGLSLSFWDGDAGPKFNNVIDGGSGAWHLGGADNNWANGDGSVNAAYADNTLAIFAGTGGTVTVDNTGGAVTASGLQFASNGYLVNGSALTLSGPESMVRVGDGTAAGAGYTATIAAALTGTTRLVKTDLGTLVLTGANSYTGGTAINGGTLRIANDANLGAAGSSIDFNGGTLNNTATMTTGRAVTLTGAGTFLTDPVTILRLDGAVTGGGRLIKSGTGSLQLNGDATHSGGTTIAAGNLQVGNGGTTGSIAGDIVNDGVLTFRRSDGYTYGGSISGTGDLVQVGDGTLTLTGNSNYGGATTIGAGELRIAGGNTVTSGDEAFVIGGVLSVDGGSVFSTTELRAESQSGVSATVNVQNGGTLRTTAGDLDLRSSGAVPVLTSLNISGAGSLADVAGGLWMGASNFDDIASVTISSGGALRTAGASQIGAPAGNIIAPLVTITGAGSNWTSTSSLRMLNGVFSVLNGGAASFTTATIGSISAAFPASVLVSGTDSSFTTTGNLIVGSVFGMGVITLAEGGLLNVGGSLALADNASARGVLNIGGGESLPAAAAGTLNTASVSLGRTTSRINFNHTDPAYSFTTLVSGIGNVNQVAGTTILTGNNSYTGTTNVSGGTLIVNGDQTAATGLTTVAAGATIGGRGTIGGNVTVTGGAINPGDIGIAPGTLTINGNLNIAAGSTLNVNLGQANVVGGAFNDLINVGGDLVLDGTLNLQTSVGGSFDTGIYRLINYAGVLTDNGLGMAPSPNLYVQTSIAKQVNLVNTAGLQFRFWDGTGAKNDGVVDGGDGVWQNFTGNDNWVDDGSIPNAPFADSAFAVFQGAAGTVTVDGGLGAVNATGMQFLTDGYVIQGDAVTLTGAQAAIRVGDGTAAGAGTTATIAAELTGTAQLLKSDLGTLILSGSNNYTGGTAINAGVLQISADANLGDAAGGLVFNGGTLRTTADFDSARGVDLAGDGTLLTDGGTTLGLAGAISGAGNLVKIGAGTLILTGANSYSGSTQVNTGALFVNGDQTGATGLTSVASGATLGGAGVIGGHVSIADGATLDPGAGGLPGLLTINGGLSLASNATLSMQFGQANVAGGALNDLIEVGGDLVLDGTINISVPTGGSFGPGIYRVLNYGGALTDNGLTLGTLPGGGTASVQTAIAGQVNLVNTAGLTLSFWDGTTGPKNNGQVDGGNGVWRLDGGSNNWTDSTGAVNADYAQDSFAIFSAAPGTVSVDNSGGNVLASGMQFASNGYVITGDALTLTGAQALIQVGDGSAAGAGYTATIASALTGTAGLVKNDLGTLVLTGTNSYAGGTTVDGGTLAIGNGGATGSIVGDIVNNGALTVNRTGALTLDGTISGTGTLTKLGSGILTLTGTNSYSGGTLVGGGTVQVSSDANLGAVAGALSLQGGTLQATSSFTSNRAILLGSPTSNTIDTQGFNVTLAGAIGDGPGNSSGNFVNKLGSGTLTLTGANTYNNRTVIAGGTLALAGAGTVGTGNLVVNAGTVFDISQTTTGARVIQLNSGPAGTIALGAKVLTLGFGASFSDWSGTITDGGIAGGVGGRVVIAAPGGAVRFFETNSYTGGTTVSSGTFVLTGNGALYSGGAVAVNPGAVFDISGLTAAGTTIGDLSGAGTIALGGKSLTFGTGNSTTVTGAISGNGGALVKTGTGTFTFGGTGTYTGGTTISAGALQLGNGGTAGSIIGDVANEGMLVFNRSNTFSLGGTISGSGAVDQFGLGTTILTGANSYGGATTVSGGTLLINGDQSLATGLTSAAGGSTLGGTGTIGGDVFVGGGAVLAPGSNGVGALTINGDLGFSPNASLAFEFGQANVPGGALNDLVNVGGDLVLDGTINVTPSAGGSFGPGVYRVINYAGALTDNGLTVGTLPGGSSAFVQTAVANQINLVNTAGLALNFWDGPAGPRNDGTIQGGDGTWVLGGGANNWTEVNGAVNADYAQSSFAIFQGTGGTVTVDNAGGNVLASGLQFTVDGYAIAGGPLTLTGAQSFVRVGDGGAGDAGLTATIDAALVGSAQLVKDMAGTLVLTGANSHTGGTAVNEGTLQISSDANLGAAAGGLSFNGGTLHTTASFTSGRAIDLVGTGTLLTDAGTVLTLDGMATGAGALAKTGAGSLVLTADNNYAGGTTISAGVLQIGNGGTTGSVTGDVTNNSLFRFDRSNALGLAGLISGSGSVEQAGSGTTMLTGTNSYTGATNVLAGMLLVNGNQSAATGLTTVASGAALGGMGTIGGSVAVADGGTLAPGAGGAGALTINGDLSLAGGSALAYDFGAANAPGSPFNDVVNVGGNLTLDGTINVAVTPGGAFDIGLYRIVNYGGTLTDNGLTIGTMPAGADLFVQTSVANQVNLINVGGATLNFWDGAAGPKFNGVVNGGSGVWQVGTGNDNWADPTGAVNAGYADGAFAIFTGTAGAVTVDNSLGAVNASGLQFAADGYMISGDALTLTGPQSAVRVGDGTAAGAGYTATIAADLTGATQLVKTDLGTLVLSGTNSYTGGTAINGGTVRIAGDANLGIASGGISFNGGTLNTSASLGSTRAVELAGAGTFLTDATTTLTLGGGVTGTGSLTKSGTGTLVLAGTGSYAGGTAVGAGTLLVNGNFGGATGITSVASGARLGGTGTIGGGVTLAGGAILTPGANGAGTLTIGGDLSLAAGASFAWEFGQANVAGGALNDLVNVGGNLTLDGTINVTVPVGGAFDAGIYRVFNYGGTLTDNGLTLGAMPGGSNVAVQTSIAGQVNLVNSAGLTLAFWDGAAGPKNNSVINGGTGTWQSGSGNDNWTDATGAVNAAYSDGAFAVFGGTGGTLTVDNGLGQVTAGGMQFAANGYTLSGGAIALTGAQSTVRVGDGSTAGAGFTATINAVLSGDTQLVKTDAGTLVLGGTNSYTGGTLINGGTVRISADANLGAAGGDVTLDGGTLATSANVTSARDIVMAGAGTISTASGTTFTFNGLLSGTGGLNKTGAGTLVLTGDSSGYAGSTRVEGTLTVNGSLCGDVNVLAGGSLGGTGTVCTTVNAGTIAPGNSIGTLTVAGSYTGVGGTLEIEAELGGDTSPADRLVVTNGTSGTTQVDVVNTGGLGAQTNEGIKIVDVTGGTSAGIFTLDGDYDFQGSPAVIAGAYGYRLFQGGVTSPTDGDWYLRSALLVAPGEPQVPLYQPGVPVYEAYGQTMLTLTDIGTLQQRIGNRQWAQTESGKPSGIWGRMQSSRSRPNAVRSTSLSDVNIDSWKLEVGADHVLSERGDGASLVLGVLGGYGEASVGVGSIYGNGSIKTKGYSAGATLTWFGPEGFYVDGRAQVTWFDSKLKSSVLGTLADGNEGMGQAYSLELGKRAPVDGKLSVTPQIQMVYTTVGFDRFTDPNDAVVSSRLGDSLKTRWGLSIDRQDAKSHLYGVANLSYEWLDGTVTHVSGTPIARENHRLWGELGLGGSLRIGDRLTLFSEVSGNTAVNDFAKSYSLKGTAGLRLAF